MRAKSQVQQFDYTDLQEWLSLNRLSWADLAREVGVSKAAVSRYKNEGKHFPTTWILTWRKMYRWSWKEVVIFCLEN